MRAWFVTAAVAAGLLVAGSAAAQPQQFTAGPGLKIPIPDGAYRGTRQTMACSTVSVPATAGKLITDAWVVFGIDHPWVGDLTAKLFSPAGTTVTLFARPGIDSIADDGSTPPNQPGSSAMLCRSYTITISDAGKLDANQMGLGVNHDQCVGSFMFNFPNLFFPDPGAAGGGDFTTLRYENPAGDWAFCVGDAVVGAAGTIDYWQLNLATTSTPPTPQPCVADDTHLCLAQSAGAAANRFQVSATWKTANGTTGTGHGVALSSDTGYFWFFQSSNVEAIVKVLNACSGFNSFWVFAGGLTDVEVQITVLDTQTLQTRVYTNPQGKAFLPIQDTAAFATCP